MSDYLVEVTRGREVRFSTPSALRAAMRSGEISPDSRIFHRATSSWISITAHPEYRKFLTEHHPPTWLAPPLPAEPADPSNSTTWGRLSGVLADFRSALMRQWLKLRPHPARSKAVTPPGPGKPSRPDSVARTASPPEQPQVEATRPVRDRWTFLT